MASRYKSGYSLTFPHLASFCCFPLLGQGRWVGVRMCIPAVYSSRARCASAPHPPCKSRPSTNATYCANHFQITLSLVGTGLCVEDRVSFVNLFSSISPVLIRSFIRRSFLFSPACVRVFACVCARASFHPGFCLRTNRWRRKSQRENGNSSLTACRYGSIIWPGRRRGPANRSVLLLMSSRMHDDVGERRATRQAQSGTMSPSYQNYCAGFEDFSYASGSPCFGGDTSAYMETLL